MPAECPCATCQRVGAVVGRLSYKPGWGLFVTRRPFRQQDEADTHDVALDVSYSPIDAGDYPAFTKRTAIVYSEGLARGVVGLMTDDMLVEWVRRILVYMETHEVDEFLRLDGARVNEPHPERVPPATVPKLTAPPEAPCT